MGFLSPNLPTPPSPSTEQPPLPTKLIRAGTVTVTPPHLLRLYVNISACHLSLSNPAASLHYASAATAVAADNDLASGSSQPASVTLARAKSLSFSGRSHLLLARAATSPSQQRPHLLRGKSDLKAAQNVADLLAAGDRREHLDEKGVASDLAAISGLLADFSRTKNVVRSESQGENLTADERMVRGSYEEGMKRFRANQIPAALTCLNLASEKWLSSSRSSPRTATIMVSAYALLAKIVSETSPTVDSVCRAAKILEDIDFNCSSAPASSRRPASFLRKAGLMYIKARKLDDGERCLKRSMAASGAGEGEDVLAKVERGGIRERGDGGGEGEDDV